MKPEEKSPVPSPCISICEMGADGLCKGCLRTIEEIAAWGRADDELKRAVWGEIRRREQRMEFK
jgi:predicted Fe-S protein YdhL (DUF1289 family)